MICPACQGNGEVEKSFLWLFTRRRPCARCRGTGRLGGQPEHGAPRAGSPDRDRCADDFPTVTNSYGASSSASSDGEFVVGSGGRSGGGGGGADWRDEREPRD